MVKEDSGVIVLKQMVSRFLVWKIGTAIFGEELKAMSLIVVVFSLLKCVMAQETAQQQTDIVQMVQDTFQWVQLAVLLEVVFKLCTSIISAVSFQRHLQETQVQQRTFRMDTGMVILVMPLSV